MIRRSLGLWIAVCAAALSVPVSASAASYFVAPPAGSPVVRPPGVTAAAPAPQAARAFLERRPAATGLDRAGARLVLTEVRREAGDTRVVRFRQEVGGVPVIGAESLVNVDSDNAVTAATGERLDGATPDLDPVLAAGDAADIALRAVARDQDVPLMSLVAGTPVRAIHEPELLGAPGPLGARLVWDLTVRTRDDRVRVRALIDASRGAVAALIGLNPDALQREVCDAGNATAQVPCVNPVRSEGEPATGQADVDGAYEFAGATYDLFSNVLGRDSIDGAGMPIVQTVRYCEPGFACPYDNAFWNGSQAVYGTGWATDDIVAHELTHGVTENSAKLFYYYQSGAINESMSDIFGEITDIKRNLNTSAERWLVGEESPVGAIRDMENPPAFDDPDRVLSPLYWDDPGDAGGVHINSGIGNKAAYLIADGGTFNGETVQAIGVDKTARIHYRALTTLLRSASDYRDLAVALPAACDALVGVNGAGGIISTSDCLQVSAAVRATQMAERPAGTAVPAPVCAPGRVPAQILFSDDMEDPASGRWIAATLTGTGTPWGYASQYPGAWPVFATSGVDNTYGDDFWATHDSVWSMASSVAIPAGAVLHFRHAHGFDNDQQGNWDGGVLEYSLNNGATWVDAGTLMTGGNGYNGQILNRPSSTNPLKGRQAFVADSKGYTATRADLSSLAGQSVRFRFRMGTDSLVYDYGWFIDDVQIHTCVPDPGDDTTPPETTITQAPAAAINTTTTSVGFTSSEPGSTFECRLDNASFAPCTSPAELSALTEGPHTFRVRAIDAAGNVDQSPAEVTFTVDLTAPETAITQAPPALINTTSTTVSFEGNEAGATFACSLDGAAFVPCSSPRQLTSLTEGPHTFEVRATDAAGNTDASPASVSFTVDLTAPQTTITQAPAAVINTTSTSVSFTSSASGSTFACSLDGAAYAACTSPRQLTSLAQGAHTFRVRATDPAGNTDSTPAEVAFVVDSVAPQTTITQAPAAVINTISTSVSFASSEAGSTFECRLDGASFAPCVSPVQLTGLSEGAHTFEVRATDAAGNTDASPASVSFTVDLTAPQTTITQAPAAVINTTSTAVSFTASEAGSTFECRLDDAAAFAPCAPPVELIGLSDGAHTFRVRATDPAGNTDPTPAEVIFTVDTSVQDTTPPETEITGAPASLINTNSTTVSFTGNEAGSTFECRLGAAAFTACASPHELTNLGDGAHTFQVRATDPAGNTDPTPAQAAFTVDTVAPQTTITQAPAAVIATTATSVSFTGNETGSTFQCRLDNEPFAPCASPLALTGLTGGAHVFQVRATDPAGNTDASPAQAAFTVDLPSPDPPADPVLPAPAPAPAPAPPASAIGGVLAPAGAAPDTRRPVITVARVVPKRFRTRTRVRVRAIARADEPGVIRVQIQRLVPGRRSAGRCRPAATTGRRCTLIVRVRALGARTSTGAASLRIAGPGVRRLAPGRYRARVTATDAAGNRSAVRTVAFRVTR